MDGDGACAGAWCVLVKGGLCLSSGSLEAALSSEAGALFFLDGLLLGPRSSSCAGGRSSCCSGVLFAEGTGAAAGMELVVSPSPELSEEDFFLRFRFFAAALLLLLVPSPEVGGWAVESTAGSVSGPAIVESGEGINFIAIWQREMIC